MIKTVPSDIADVLKLRQQLAKSSVKKYQKMGEAACADGRARGMFQFYGANRTGRWAGRMIQLQNLPQNHLPDLAEARSVVKSGDYELMTMLYDDVPDVLSQLIRTAFVPRKGYKFVVSDFSSIEARVLSFIAKEQWRIDAFAKGEDIYCMSASQMFGVPVEKHGQNADLRQKGKIAELACIAKDSLVMTDKGEIPIQYVTKNQRVWDGRHWVNHDGVVFKGFRPIIHYDGLSATEDHLVYVENQSQPIEFGEAVSHRMRLRKKHRRGYSEDFYKGFAPVYDILNAGPKHRFTVSGCLVHNCGYGGSTGALKKMGALEMELTEEELQPLVDYWRSSNPHIVQFWRDVDHAVLNAVRNHTTMETHGLRFIYQSGMLFIELPSGRRLTYVKPRIGENQFGGECVTFEGIGPNKKWERLESYAGRFVENIIQAISRDILAYAMKTLRHCFIVGHVHDELIIECSRDVSVDALCEQMSRTPPWMPGLQLRADGYECEFYQKD